MPALEIMVERYDVDDVGATFMAAGGSAPELFTAMVSTLWHHPQPLTQDLVHCRLGCL